MQALQEDMKESLKQVECKVARSKAAKKTLAFENSVLLTRLERANHSIDSILQQARRLQTERSMPQKIWQQRSDPSARLQWTSQQPHQHLTAQVTVVKSAQKQTIFGSEPAQKLPRPLSTCAHTASFGYKDILPHLGKCEHHRTASAAHAASSKILFADVRLVTDAIDCHRTQVVAQQGVNLTKIAWYRLSSYQARPGLCISQSSTIGSTACLLSAILCWILVKYEAACLVVLEDKFRAAQSLSTSGWHDVQSTRADNACCLNTDPKLPWASHCADFGSEQRGTNVPDAPLSVSTPQLQLLRKYGLMCGEKQPVQILEAVRYVLRGLLLRYHKQLPLAVWRRICLQCMKELQRRTENFASAASSTDASHHEQGEWPEECPWACIQEVVGDMYKLIVFIFHDGYCQSFKQGGLQSESGGISEAVMSHEQVVGRLHEVSCSCATLISVWLSDAPGTIRNLAGSDVDQRILIPMVRSCIH